MSASPDRRRRGVAPPKDDRYIEGRSIPLAAGAMKARVHVSLKSGVLDPQGKAIGNALASLGFTGLGEVRQGKLIELDLTETDPARARAEVERMCKDLLANPVIEDYSIELC
jgi:phosphoribosylformylglycinamidine synthase subunit PurS